jgi:hypothetical protein
MGLFNIFLSRYKEFPERYYFYDEKTSVFEFEFSELLESINLPLEGGNYKRLRESLNTIFSTRLELQEADSEVDKIIRTTWIHPIRKFTFNTASIENATRGSILFEDFVYHSLIQGNYIMVSLVLFSELDPTAQLLYLNILERSPETKVSVNKLINHIFPETSNRTKSKESLDKAFAQLIEFDVITDIKEKKIGRSLYYEYTIHDVYLKQSENKSIMEQGYLSLF